MQAIAHILTKNSPQGLKYKQGCTISLGDQANGYLDEGDSRVAKRFWLSQSDLRGLVGEAQCNHGRGHTHFIPTKKKPTRVQTPVGAPSLLENSKEMILSLKEWLANEIRFLSEVEAWKMESPGGNHEGRKFFPKNEIVMNVKCKLKKSNNQDT
jgi:hypothetical protein